MIKTQKNTRTVSYKLGFIDNWSLKKNSLSSVADNYAGGIHKIKIKSDMFIKIYETCGITYKDCECCLEYAYVKYDLILYKCLCNKYVLTTTLLWYQYVINGRKRYQGWNIWFY